MNVLTPLQRDFLSNFFAQPAAQAFVLTGGTALAAFYLHHRISEDLDLFALMPMTEQTETGVLEAGRLAAIAAAVAIGATWQSRALTNLFQQMFITRPGETPLKVDLVHDPSPTFGEPIEVEGIRVDSLLNIAANKITAVFTRAAARDFVDLYFILHSGLDFDMLVGLAKQKDLGLNEFELSREIALVSRLGQDDMPHMIKPLDLDEMKRFFLDLSDKMLLRLKPE